MHKRLFISHISEERNIAERIKGALARDFLGLVEVFVSSDTESIAAGEEWLRSIEKHFVIARSLSRSVVRNRYADLGSILKRAQHGCVTSQ